MMSLNGTTSEVKSFDEIAIGDNVSSEHKITAESIEAFAALSGDRNPLHWSADFAKDTVFRRPVAHGMLLGGYVSALIGMQLPGPGALWTQQDFRWLAPVFAGDCIRVTLKVIHKSPSSQTIAVAVEAVNQQSVKIMEGNGVVMMVDRQHAVATPLSERVVFVTGGSRGIGAAIAKAFRDGGANVAVGFNESSNDAEQLCADVTSKRYENAVPVQVDVRDPVKVRNAVDEIEKYFGRPVDILINSAGNPTVWKPFADTSWDDLESMMEIHLRGTFLCCQAVLPGMLRLQRGSIVNIGSAFAEGTPPPQCTALVTVKSALKGLTRSMATELGTKGIRVNMVSPGMTSTGSTAHIPERWKKLQVMQTPIRRLCEPEDVADAVLLLCSRSGSFLTGVDVPVCGGNRM